MIAIEQLITVQTVINSTNSHQQYKQLITVLTFWGRANRRLGQTDQWEEPRRVLSVLTHLVKNTQLILQELVVLTHLVKNTRLILQVLSILTHLVKNTQLIL